MISYFHSRKVEEEKLCASLMVPLTMSVFVEEGLMSFLATTQLILFCYIASYPVHSWYPFQVVNNPSQGSFARALFRYPTGNHQDSLFSLCLKKCMFLMMIYCVCHLQMCYPLKFARVRLLIFINYCHYIIMFLPKDYYSI